jgi:hypothetical protein
MTTFNPADFLNQTFDEANSTVSVPVPEGEFLAIADKVDLNTWQKRDGSASGLKLDIVWDIQDAELLAMLDRPKATSRQSIMLDLTETGQLDFGKGKNVQLGRLRAALDLNEPGKPFSFPMITGRMGKVSIKHRIDGDQIYSEVKAVAHP